MSNEKNEIEKLIDTMISSGDDLVQKLKTVLPDSLSESMMLFHESNIANLKKNLVDVIANNHPEKSNDIPSNLSSNCSNFFKTFPAKINKIFAYIFANKKKRRS